MLKKAILCVDDEKIILQSLKAQIKKHLGDQYQYEFAESAEEAWEVIQELYQDGIPVLVIVSDWLMPDMKGDELLIQVHEKFPEIVKVMLTGHANDEAIERARQEANLQHCLHKPWKEEDLIEILATGLANL